MPLDNVLEKIEKNANIISFLLKDKELNDLVSRKCFETAFA